MRSRFLAIIGSIVFSAVILIGLALNGRVAAEPEAPAGLVLPTNRKSVV